MRFRACGIGLPLAPVAGDMNGLRIGTPELVRWGVTGEHAARLASLIADVLTGDPEAIAPEVQAFRAEFRDLHYVTT